MQNGSPKGHNEITAAKASSSNNLEAAGGNPVENDHDRCVLSKRHEPYKIAARIEGEFLGNHVRYPRSETAFSSLGERGRAGSHNLTAIIYKELRLLAATQLPKERAAHTLQPTALVNEAYLRLVDQRSPNWQSRTHFFGVAARLMRQILVDHARRRQAGKRAGLTVSLDEAASFRRDRSADLIALDLGLNALEKLEERKCKAVELRYFGGLSIEEIAEALEVSPVTVRRDLRMAEAWLHNQMRSA